MEPCTVHRGKHMRANQLRHGYGHSGEHRSADDIDGPLAYHVRRYRQQYGSRGISQNLLAMIAHVSRFSVEDLESTSKLRPSIELLLRVAIALHCRVDDLIAPDCKRRIEAEIERRAAMLGGDANRTAPTHTPERPFQLAVAYRSPQLLTALSDGTSILEIRPHRVRHTEPDRIRAVIACEAKAYGVRNVVVEAGSRTSDCFFSIGIPHRVLTLRRAKLFVLGKDEGTPPSNKPFFRQLVEQHPELRRYVKILPLTGDVAMSEEWRIARLVVAALALAAPAATTPVARAVKGDPCAPPAPRRRLSA